MNPSPNGMVMAEYVWMVQSYRWLTSQYGNYDESSTVQAPDDNSEVSLRSTATLPILSAGVTISGLVQCFHAPTRAATKAVIDQKPDEWLGLESRFTRHACMLDSRLLASMHGHTNIFPENKYAKPRHHYYFREVEGN